MLYNTMMINIQQKPHMIENQKNKMTPDEPLILYHGSRKEISGNIRPESRPNCDFGTGFYMGTNPAQVKGLVSTSTNPVFYEIRFNPAELPAYKKIFLDGTAWLCTVIGFRSSDRRIQNLPAVQKAKEEINNADLVVGAIADDRMNDALRRFMSNGLSDEALIQCLRSVDYGYQYVLKTPKACSCVEIIRSHLITGTEKQQAVSYSEMKRSESQNIINRMAGRYNREGHFLQEIIENPDLLQYQSQNQKDDPLNR